MGRQKKQKKGRGPGWYWDLARAAQNEMEIQANRLNSKGVSANEQTFNEADASEALNTMVDCGESDGWTDFHRFDLSSSETFDWSAVVDIAPGPSDRPPSDENLACSWARDDLGLTRAQWNGIVKLMQDQYEIKIPSERVLSWQQEKWKRSVYFDRLDACVNGCCVWDTSSDSQLYSHCHHCNESRLDNHGRPRRQTAVWSLPRLLQVLLLRPGMAKKMVEYRASRVTTSTQASAQFWTDSWDGVVLRRLMEEGGPLHASTAIAVSLTGDAAPYSLSPKKSAMIHMAIVHNIPPVERSAEENRLVLAVHHGEPKDDSLWAAICRRISDCRELERLRRLNFDGSPFTLTVVCETGDFPASAAAIGVVDQSGKCSCRKCSVVGFRGCDGNNHYYLAPSRPQGFSDPGLNENFSPWVPGERSIPLRTRADQRARLEERKGMTPSLARLARRDTGYTKRTALLDLIPQEVELSELCPADVMHALLLNVTKHLCGFITNKQNRYSGESFVMPKSVEEDFVADLTAATSYLHPALVRRPVVDFRKERTRAEHWAAIGRLVPIMMQNRATETVLQVFVLLCQIIELTSSARLPASAVDELQSKITSFQKAFYDTFYGRKTSCLHVCLVYFHFIGHLPEDLVSWGPFHTTAQYPMERLAGDVTRWMKRNPQEPVLSSANIINRRMQLGLRYGLQCGSRSPQLKDPHLFGRKRTDVYLTPAEYGALQEYSEGAHGISLSDGEAQKVTKREKFLSHRLDTYGSAEFSEISVGRGSLRENYFGLMREGEMDSQNVYVRIQSFFEHGGELLAFAKSLRKLETNKYQLRYCRTDSWSDNVTVVKVSWLRRPVSFVRNSTMNNRMWLFETGRIYTNLEIDELYWDDDE